MNLVINLLAHWQILMHINNESTFPPIIKQYTTGLECNGTSAVYKVILTIIVICSVIITHS